MRRIQSAGNLLTLRVFSTELELDVHCQSRLHPVGNVCLPKLCEAHIRTQQAYRAFAFYQQSGALLLESSTLCEGKRFSSIGRLSPGQLIGQFWRQPNILGCG